jgi:very-short-patch-repair endonuclease
MPRIRRGQPDKLPFKRRLRNDMTASERRLWTQLRSRQFHSLRFRRQHGIGPYIVDFYCPALLLVLEVDGDTHGNQSQTERDCERTDYFRSLGLHVLRYTNTEILENLDGVLEDLTKKLKGLTPQVQAGRRNLPPPL